MALSLMRNVAQSWRRRKKFPAVAVMKRIERGGAAQASDIKVLKELASPWIKEHATPLYGLMNKRLRNLDMIANFRHERIDELWGLADVLYAGSLAKDIQARHERALAVVRRWENGWEAHVSGFLRWIGNE